MVVRITRSHDAFTTGRRTGGRRGATCGFAVAFGAQPSARNPSAAMPASDKPVAGFTTHVVKRGESLWSIAEKYNVTVQEIFRWNKLKNSRIQAGKRLKVKSSKDGDSDDA